MNKHKNYHMYGILAIVILILLIIFFSLYIGRNTNGSSASKASPPASSPGTDIIKDAGDDAEVNAYLEEQDTIISDMLENMRVKQSGSAELDFLISMIPQYEASVDLSKSYLISDETEASSNVEKAYIEGMIIHHQMAADMAETILKFSSHREICNTAEDIFETQKEEISEMEEIFNDM